MLKTLNELTKKQKIALLILGGIIFLSFGIYIGSREYSKVEAVEIIQNNEDTSKVDPEILKSTSSLSTDNSDPLNYNLQLDSRQNCSGTWINLPTTGKIDLSTKSLNEWGLHTEPMVISETQANNNIVAIGHNICSNGNCYSSGSAFGNLINTKIGDKAELCADGKLNSGFVVVSEPMNEYSVHILSDWLGYPSVTLFTSYGQCKDNGCTSTVERWVVAFGR